MSEITRLTLTELSAALEAKQLSSREATLAYFDEIDRRNASLNAYITLTRERALERADAADRRRASGETGALLGVPMAMKDNVCTAGVRTTCSSRMLENYVPSHSATVFERLERDGAVMLGKANLDEFAMGSTTGSSYFGRSLNPRETHHVPGGSSGGSAAAVAGELAPFAIGTDTGGSIRQPAAFCGIVGLKPTYGAISRYGIAELAGSLDQAGTLTRTARDCALLMNHVAFHDPRDATSRAHPTADFTADLDRGVKDLRVALLDESFSDTFSPSIRSAVDSAAHTLERLGAQVDRVSAPRLFDALPAYYIISCAEASANLARYDGRFAERCRGQMQRGEALGSGRQAGSGSDLASRAPQPDDLTNSSETYEKLVRRSRSEGFGAEVKRRLTLGSFVLDGKNYENYYNKALKVRALVIDEYARLFENYDLILTPTTPTTAYRIGGPRPTGDTRFISDLCAVAANLGGVPALNLPFGDDENGLPIGIQLTASAWRESTIFRAAVALERENGVY